MEFIGLSIYLDIFTSAKSRDLNIEL